MLKYTYQALLFFRNAFSRNSTWLMFCMVILEFIRILRSLSNEQIDIGQA